MAELIVVGFKGTQRASEVLEQVRGLDDRWKIFLEDAVSVYRTENGKLRVDQSVQPTGKEGAGSGAVLGGLIGALLAAPFTAGASIPAAGAALAMGGMSGAALGGILGGTDAEDSKQLYGISDEFVQDVGGMVQPGQSAVFILVRTYDPAEVAERFRGYGGQVLRTTLSKKAAAKLQASLDKRQMVTGV
jgi:uncharacterized membrane protein